MVAHSSLISIPSTFSCTSPDCHSGFRLYQTLLRRWQSSTTTFTSSPDMWGNNRGSGRLIAWSHQELTTPLAIRAGERKRVRASAPLRLPQSPTIPDSADLSLNPLLSTKTPRCTHPYQGWLRHATQTCQCKLSSRGDNREVANPCDPPLFAPASCHTGTDYGADMLFFTDGCR